MNGLIKSGNGVYRWYYEFGLFKNPAILLALWKVFGVITGLLWVFVTLISLRDYDFIWNGFISNTKFFLLFFVGIEILCLVSYLIYALIMGGKYYVVFEMDKKESVIYMLRDNLKSAADLFPLCSWRSGFGFSGCFRRGNALRLKENALFRVAVCQSVKSYRRRNIIYINSPFSKNQVYAEAEDFDFVLDFIQAHTPDAKHKFR